MSVLEFVTGRLHQLRRTYPIENVNYCTGIHMRDPNDRDPNDDRSDSMNPNNDAYQDNMDNHSDQLNPNNNEYGGGQANDDQDG